MAKSFLNEWKWQPPWAFGYLIAEFWNWQPVSSPRAAPREPGICPAV
jgi:hypothetical protein